MNEQHFHDLLRMAILKNGGPLEFEPGKDRPDLYVSAFDGKIGLFEKKGGAMVEVDYEGLKDKRDS